MKIMPHCWDDFKSVRFFASTVEEMKQISGYLEKIYNNNDLNKIINSDDILLFNIFSNKEKLDILDNLILVYYLLLKKEFYETFNNLLINKDAKYFFITKEYLEYIENYDK
jgi:hypothetical protein